MNQQTPLEFLLSRLDQVKQRGSQWQARCPAHDDKTASLSVTEGDHGAAVLKCHANCSTGAVVDALGLKMSDLFPPKPAGRNGASGKQIVATYDYRNLKGELLYQAVRYHPKDFRQRRPDPVEHGKWIWNLEGVPRVLYRALELRDAMNRDHLIFIPEGEKDVDRLRDLGLAATTNVGGAGKWKDEYSRTLQGARVVLLPDNDGPGREHAQKAGASLAGAAHSVQVLALPGLPEKGDVSDWLKAGGTSAELERLAAAAPVWEPEQPGEAVQLQDEAPATGVGPTAELADATTAAHAFAQDGGGKLYVFQDGAYVPGGEKVIQQAVKQLMCDRLEKWTSHRAREVCEYIRVDAPLLWDRPPGDRINVRNGLLDLRALQLLPHAPTFLSAVQLPVTFNPAAKCPEWDRFIETSFPEDAFEVAFEIAALLMIPGLRKKRAILLQGEGNNGKSVYLNALQCWLGKRNVSNASLQGLSSDRFTPACLLGKLANICPDIPSTHLEDSSVFKAITGDDPLQSEYKFRDSFTFTPFSRLIFSCNTLPRSKDAGEAFFNRWVVVPFTRTFADNGPDTIPREVLDARLTEPAELSGVLNRALALLPRVLERGITVTDSMRAAWDEFRKTTDPVSVWLERHVVCHPGAHVRKGELYQAYTRDCERMARPVPTDKAFKKDLLKVFPDVQEGQRRYDGKAEWCWIGLGLRSGVADPDKARRTTSVTGVTGSSLFVSDSIAGELDEREEAGEWETETDKPECVTPVTGVPSLATLAEGAARNGAHDPDEREDFIRPWEVGA